MILHANDAAALLDILRKIPNLLPYKAWVIAANGRADEAAALLRSQRGESPRNYPFWIIAGDACLLTQDKELARQAFDAPVPQAKKNRFFCGPSGSVLLGPTTRILGDPALGRYLAATLKTGTLCSFSPV